VLSYQFDWGIVLTGKYAGWLVSGIITTIQLSLVAIVLSFLLDC